MLLLFIASAIATAPSALMLFARMLKTHTATEQQEGTRKARIAWLAQCEHNKR